MNARFSATVAAPCALALSLIAAPYARAAASFVVTPIPVGAQVTLNGRPIAVLRTANLGLAPADRAALAVQRLKAFLDPGGRPIAIQPHLLTEGAGVFAGDTLVMVATAAEAEAQHRTPAELADRWARNLRAALTLPPLAAGKQRSTHDAQRSKATRVAQRLPLDARKTTINDQRRNTAPPERLNARTPERPNAPGPPPNAPDAAALILATRELIVPVGESRTIRVTAPGPVTLDAVDTASVEADITGVEGKVTALTIRGVTAGKTAVRVICGDDTATLSVTVMKYAGQLPPGIAATVTGRPCPLSLTRTAAQSAIRDALALEPGATCELGAAVGLNGALAPGGTASARVPVRITGTGLLPVEREVTVRVANRALPAEEARVLLYSNNPESFTAAGSLFLGALESGVPTRLLYHHQNMIGRAVFVRVDLLNLGDEPVETQVIEGAAGPTWDTVMVGHRATARYVQNFRQEAGTIVALAPHTRRTILSERVPEKLAVSGLYGLQLLTPASHDRVRVEVVADDAATAPAEAPPEMAARPLSDHVYTQTRKEVHARFDVGGNWTFISVGKKAVHNQDQSKRLDGNYGILYDIALELSNPTDIERVVSLSLSPDAGAAMGVFVIDGALVEAPSVSPPTEAPLASFRLRPGEHRTVPIQTIPVGGSNYPISLVVRAAAPGTPVAKKLAAGGGGN